MAAIKDNGFLKSIAEPTVMRELVEKICADTITSEDLDNLTILEYLLSGTKRKLLSDDDSCAYYIIERWDDNSCRVILGKRTYASAWETCKPYLVNGRLYGTLHTVTEEEYNRFKQYVDLSYFASELEVVKDEYPGLYEKLMPSNVLMELYKTLGALRKTLPIVSPAAYILWA